MNRIQLACYALTASAFVLAGLLTLNHQPNEAQASEVITQQGFTLMTALTAEDEESLFILNNSSGNLLVYTQELRGNAGELVLVGQIELGPVFDRIN